MASKINEYICNFFKTGGKLSVRYYDINYINNNCFNLFVNKIKLDENTYLIPAIKYRNNEKHTTPTTLYRDSHIRDDLSETTLLRDLGYYHSHSEYDILSLKTKSNEIYYGGPGIALDSNFNILMLIVYKVDNSSKILDTYCFVNPSVFINDKRTLEKSIIKKIVPTISIRQTYRNITFVFKDVTKDFIYIPKAPDNNFNEEVVDSFLIDKIDSILEELETNFT